MVQFQETDPGVGDDDDEEGGGVFRFNEYEIRDAFLEFMTGIMFGYTKFLVNSLFLYTPIERS